MTSGPRRGSNLSATGERGAVQLVEMPTDDEIMDNVIAYWIPEKPTQAGDRIDLHYRVHWLADEPFPTALGRSVATRLGRGGEPGQPRPFGVRKFLVEVPGRATFRVCLRHQAGTCPLGVARQILSNHARGRALGRARALARAFRSHRRWT